MQQQNSIERQLFAFENHLSKAMQNQSLNDANKAILALRKTIAFADSINTEWLIQGLSVCLKFNLTKQIKYFKEKALTVKNKPASLLVLLAEDAYLDGQKQRVREYLGAISASELKNQQEIAESLRLWRVYA